MTDAELQAWWPALGLVVTELRRTEQPAIADALVDAVRAGACSSEILGGVGMLLHQNRVHQPRLSDPAAVAWDAVMADVYRAFPDLRIRHWFLRLVGH
jgi:hypothetical protein